MIVLSVDFYVASFIILYLNGDGLAEFLLTNLRNLRNFSKWKVDVKLDCGTPVDTEANVLTFLQTSLI